MTVFKENPRMTTPSADDGSPTQRELFQIGSLGQLPAAVRRREWPALPALDGEQAAAISSIRDFLAEDQKQSFVLHGLAGTGKTTVLAHVAHELPRACLASPTAKAAAVLSAKTGSPAGTLHSLIYSPPQRVNGRLVFASKREPGSLVGYVALVDEGSMIDQIVAQDLLATGIRVVAVGDPGQLPPVNGRQFFTTPDVMLTHVRRQAADSPIIRQAHAVRAGGDYSSDGDAFQIIGRREAAAAAEWADIVLCWRNETRHRVNAFLRSRRGIAPDAPPQPGEPIIALRNDRFAGVLNGEIHTVKHYVSRHLELNTGAVFREPRLEWLHEARGDRNNEADFGLAYAITVHKAQGSEWPRVLIFDEFSGNDRARWLYTAVTRASDAVRVVRHVDAGGAS